MCHTGGVEIDYLGDRLGRPVVEPLSWFDDVAEPTTELFVAADVTRAEVLGLFERCTAHADATIEALPWMLRPGSRGGARRGPVPMQLLMVHLSTEHHRHAGYADIVRELVDGGVGYRWGSTGSQAPRSASMGSVPAARSAG